MDTPMNPHATPTRLVVSSSPDPFLNVAVENHLLAQDESEAVTLYLWRNHRTVVIGQNQNPYSECNVELLEGEGGHLMRRATGGGAVYHDMANLNFSFIVPNALYDTDRQFGVLRKAVESYGLTTELSGRNDVLCEGRKFSGNAFSRGKHQRLHHGTILIKVNTADMQRYLKVKPSKLQRHGVASVRSRVVNLSELAPVTSDNIMPRLRQAFEETYGSTAQTLPFDVLARDAGVQELRRKFESREWRFDRWTHFSAQLSAQFAWGAVEIALRTDEASHRIVRAQVATDALDTTLPQRLEGMLVGADTRTAPTPAGLSEEERDVAALVWGT